MKKNMPDKSGTLVFVAVLLIATITPFFFGTGFMITGNHEYPFPLYTQGEQVNVEYSNHRGIESNLISFTINGFDAESIELNEEVYHALSIAGEAISLKEGYPELPRISRSIIIPDQGVMEVRVVEKEYIEYDSIRIVPSKGSLSRTEHPVPSEVPYVFGEIYQENAWYPKDIVSLREPHIIRDFRGQVVELNPFQYHPTENRLRVYTEVELEVFYAGEGGLNTLNRRGPLETVQRDFAKIYERRFLNYRETLSALRYDPVEEEGEMLVITHDDFAHLMYPFVDWKNMRGLPTEMVNLSDIGDRSDDIKDFVANYYHNSDLTYLLLVGDDDHVPTPRPYDLWSRASDPSYSFIEGQDYYPDIFVGRFSASEPAHVQTQVERSIHYEQYLGGEWRNRAVGIASDEGPGYQNMMDYEFIDMMGERLLDYDYVHVDSLHDSGHGDLPGSPTPQDVSNVIEDGRNLINYAGHGLVDHIHTSGFSTSHMAELQNVNKLPFFITVACLTGNFVASEEPCFAEKWLRATHDGKPTGGIAAFSSSKLQDWSPPMAAMDEMMHLYTRTYEDNFKITTGGIAFNGCMYMNDIYSNGWEETATWHIFGDPSLTFGMKIPEGDPPEVDVERPDGGEIFQAGTQEPVEWSTHEGDDPIDRVDIHYSIDGGHSWTEIVRDTPDTGTYSWTVPNVHSTQCMVRVMAMDIMGRWGEDISSHHFTIEGIPPAPPGNLAVEHGCLEELVTNGVFHEDHHPWTKVRITNQGEAGWTEEHHIEGGSVRIRAEAQGSGNVRIEQTYWEQSLYPISSEITLAGAFRKDIFYDSGFGWSTHIHQATVEILVHDTEAGWQSALMDDDTSLGDTGWQTFSPWVYTPSGFVDAVRVRMHVEAEGDTGPMGGARGANGELWVDGISVMKHTDTDTEDNFIKWDASVDDPEDVSHYNVYRSQYSHEQFEHIGQVTASGSSHYSYVDFYKGTVDETEWWYMVRAVGRNGREEENTNSVREPGYEMPTFQVPLSTDGPSQGWNFVSFNLVPHDTSLESILEHADFGISGSYDRVSYFDASTGRWYSHVPGRPDHFNNLLNWDHTMGIWIRMIGDDTLTVEGTVPGTSNIELHPGWNMVGYPVEGPDTGVPQGIDRIGYFHAASDHNIAYTQGVENFQFNPGQGYWIHNGADETILWTLVYG